MEKDKDMMRMKSWKDITIKGIPSIKKCVGEYNIGEIKKTPYAKFKVKVYEKKNGKFYGITNLQIKDQDGCPIGGIGYGNTIEEALEDTIRYFLKMLEEKEEWAEEDFECADPYDF